MKARTPYPYAFEGRIVHHHLGTIRYTVVFLPDELAAQLPFNGQPRLRAKGRVGGIPISGAWQPSHGRWYLMLSQRVLRSSGFGVDDAVAVEFGLDDPERVETPPALQQAIDADADVKAFWDSVSAGKRRAMAHMVASAKGAQTREARLERVMDGLRAGEVLGPPSASRTSRYTR